MSKKIVVIGNSIKFINILNSIYPKANLEILPWRNLNNFILKKKIKKKINIIFICGYDYKSQFYDFKKYYKVNVTDPLSLVKSLVSKFTEIIYVDTIKNLNKNSSNKKNYSLSRYEYAKKELAYKLSKKFKSLKILELPVIKKKNGLADIYGGVVSNLIFNFFIYFKLIKSIDVNEIKKLIIKKFNTQRRNYRLRPILLSIPRTHFIDRILRFIFD